MRPVLIGICGGSGAGKTCLAERLKACFEGEAAILSQDSYYLNLGPLTPEEKSTVNFDHPDALDNALLSSELERLISGYSISVPIYDYVTAQRVGAETLDPHGVIIVEGLFLFFLPSLVSKFDLKVFVEADEAVRVGRIRHRDIVLRRQPESLVELKISQFVLPMDERFIQPYQKVADIVVNNSSSDPSAIHHAASQIAAEIRLKRASLEADRSNRSGGRAEYPFTGPEPLI